MLKQTLEIYIQLDFQLIKHQNQNKNQMKNESKAERHTCARALSFSLKLENIASVGEQQWMRVRVL